MRFMKTLLCCVAFVFALVLAGVLVALPSGTSGVRARDLGSPGEPQFGPDVMVNGPPPSTPFYDRNPSVAINPVNPNNAIAAYTTSDLDGGISGYSATTDGGHTWTPSRFIDDWPGPVEPLRPFGDSRVVFDSAGVAYYTSLALGNSTSGYYVITSTNGVNWGSANPIVVADYSVYHSQSGLAVDPRLTGPNARSLYVAWLKTTSSNPSVAGIWLRYSRDGGLTWSDDVQVSSAGDEYSYAPSVAVASDGTVYVAFEELDNYYIGNPPKLFLTRSTDGGRTWSPDQLITGAPITAIGRADFKGRELTLLGGESCNLMRINHFPSIAVSPSDPNSVYVTWNDGRWETVGDMCGYQGRHSDIAFSRTSDGGATWTSPIRLNDDGTETGVDHWQPVMAARPDGLIGVTWYDRRYDPSHYLYDVVYTQSSDGGNTFTPNRRVTDLSSNADAAPDYKGIDDLGTRKALAISPGYALPLWFDTRNGQRRGDIYADRGAFLGGSPTATVFSTSTPTYTPTRTPTLTGSPTSSPTRTPDPTASGTLVPSVTASNTRTPTSTSIATSTATGTVTSETATPTAQSTATSTAVVTATLTQTPVPSSTASVTETAVATFTPCPMSFTDVQSSDWFSDYVQCLYCRGAISGYSDGTFRPNNNTTRGQLCKIVVVGFNLPTNTNGGPHFSDVPVGSTFYGYIETAYHAGIISGYSDGTFKWGNNVTRGQLSKIVVSAARWALINPPTNSFSDVPVGSTFYSYVETAYCHSIISGYSDGTFKPGNNATRAQIAKIVCLAVRNETTCSTAAVAP